MGIGVISVVRKAPLEWPGGREGTNSAEVWGQRRTHSPRWGQAWCDQQRSLVAEAK